MPTTTSLLETKFNQALPWEPFLVTAQEQGHRPKWDERYSQLSLTARQQALLESFVRPMKILCLTGAWCGDCALQGAALQRIAEARPDLIELRFIPRSDEHADLIVPNQINAGFRVPLTFFMAEDFEPVSRIGDRTLSRYRSMARKQLGDAAPVLPPPPPDPLAAVLQEMLDETERVHLLLRLSTRMREKYGD